MIMSCLWNLIISVVFFATLILLPGQIMAQYSSNGNGTVTDMHTGLVWQQGDSQNDSWRLYVGTSFGILQQSKLGR